MKLKTLAAICKREGVFYLCDRIGVDGKVQEQWLGTGSSMYQLSGLPYLAEENLPTLFDITEKQCKNLVISHKNLPETLNFDDGDSNESVLNREKFTIGYNGKIIRPFVTCGGVEFIDDVYLEPLADVADELELYERHTEGGRTYIAAKVGLLLVGVIMPHKMIDEEFVDVLDKLIGKCRTVLDKRSEKGGMDEL